MTDIIQTVEQDAVKAWDGFLAGLTWLGKEITVGVDAIEKLDPGIQQQLQALLSAGEAAATAYGGAGVGAAVNIIASLGDSVEQATANAFQAATNNNPAAQAVSAATVGVLQQISTAAQAAVPIAVAKLAAAAVNALSAGAAQANGAAQPAPQ